MSGPQQGPGQPWGAPPASSPWPQPQPQPQPEPAWPAAPAAAPAPTPAPGPPPTPLPVPPAPVVVAAVVGVLALIGVLVAALVDGLPDLLTASSWQPTDADVLPAVLAVPVAGVLAGGIVAALARRGGGLLTLGGVLLAVCAAGVLAWSVLEDADGLRIGLAAALLLAGVALAVLAGLPASRRWYGAGERRSAERAIGRAVGRPDRPAPAALPGRGIGWSLAAAALAVGVIGVTALVVAGSAPELGGPAGVEGATPLPVDPGSADFDPDLHDLAVACSEGDLSACDRLYARSPFDSEYEDYGSTCGWRSDEPYYGTCAESFD
ncbi:hypothetical protein [Blastococcus sp. SYSU D00820]